MRTSGNSENEMRGSSHYRNKGTTKHPTPNK